MKAFCADAIAYAMRSRSTAMSKSASPERSSSRLITYSIWKQAVEGTTSAVTSARVLASFANARIGTTP